MAITEPTLAPWRGVTVELYLDRDVYISITVIFNIWNGRIVYRVNGSPRKNVKRNGK